MLVGLYHYVSMHFKKYIFFNFRHLNQNRSHLTGLGVPIAPRLPTRMHQFNSREGFLGFLKK